MCSLLVAIPAIAAQPKRDARVSTKGEVVSAHRVAASPSSAPAASASQQPKETTIDTRAAEKEACVSRNATAGNIFVWASKTNNGNYESMIEDTKNPDNNACFVRVTLKSKNPKTKINESSKYFITDGRYTCGDWENEEKIKQQILDSKKSGRVGGTIAGAVGGAAVGVGTMELVGNKIIGGKVQGQKALSDEELLRSQMLAAGKEKDWKKYEESQQEISNLCEELHALGGTSKECGDE